MQEFSIAVPMDYPFYFIFFNKSKQPIVATEAFLSSYKKKGFISPIPVFSPLEMKSYRESLNKFLKSTENENLTVYRGIHYFFPWCNTLARDERIVDLVSKLLGDDIIMLGIMLLTKHPNSPSYVCWHQDSAYSSMGFTPSLTFSVAITECNVANGCMSVCEGSHLKSLEHERFTGTETHLLNQDLAIPDQVLKNYNLHDIVLQPGEASIHHPKIAHSSAPNTSDNTRASIIIRFATSAIKIVKAPVIRIKGNKDLSHLEVFEGEVPTDFSEGIQKYLSYLETFKL